MIVPSERMKAKFGGELEKAIPRKRRLIPTYACTLLIQLLPVVLVCTTAVSHAFSFQPHVLPLRRHPSSMTSSDKPQNYPKRYKKLPIKTKKEIRTVLKHQFSHLRKLHHVQNSNTNIRTKSPPASTHPDSDISDLSSLESNIYNSIWASRNVREVQQVLTELIDTSKEIIHQATPHLSHDITKKDGYEDLDSNNVDIQLIGPNIATAALRRVIDLRPDFKGRSPKTTKDEEDVGLARTLILQLLQVVGREVVHAESGKDVSRVNEEDIYTFSNLIVSIRIITASRSPNDLPLFTTGMSHVSNANVLYSLAKIKMLQKRNGKHNDESTLIPLARKICVNIRTNKFAEEDDNNSSTFVKRVKPVLLIETLRGLATFNIKNEEQLLQGIGDRLKQGDATGKLNGEQLSLGLWAYASLECPHLGLLKSFTRRLRKANVRRDLAVADICRAIWAVGQSMKQLDFQDTDKVDLETGYHDKSCSDEEIALLREDLVTMLYTLSGELLRPKSTNGVNGANVQMKKLHGLGISQITDVLSTLVIFEFDPDHEIIQELESHIQNRIISHPNEFTPTYIARILWSFQRLHRSLDPQTLHTLVTKFEHRVFSENVHKFTPKTLNVFARSVVMMLPDHGAQMPELHSILSRSLKEEAFLQQCNEFECSNFIWCLSMAKIYDKDLMRLLSDRMRQEDIISSLTPSSASRFLWSFTSLVEYNAEDLEMKEILFENFQILGGILLSIQLTPVDASCAMWAMAKSSYALDMGIFDHLAEVLAADFMLEHATIQQITVALWSCGKMISWEDPLREKMEFGDFTVPPYVKNGERFASYLATCYDIMSPKDISQAIWAIGRLKISDHQIVHPFVTKASEIAVQGEFNSQELANILWALSKVDYDDPQLISHFTDQIQRPVILNSASSQEAANILYALGKMRIRDEDTFSCMNAVLMKQLENATSQTIANALWAHDNVDLQPPRQLFDSWAKEKLDIVGLYLDNQQVEIIQHSKQAKIKDE